MRYDRDKSDDALYIDTPEALDEWLEFLRGADVIAVGHRERFVSSL